MALYPAVQRKVQRELDEVVGSERLPAFEDYESLPYLQATLMETARWIPTAPLAIGHTVTQDDFYREFFIPKGTAVWPVSYEHMMSLQMITHLRSSCQNVR